MTTLEHPKGFWNLRSIRRLFACARLRHASGIALQRFRGLYERKRGSGIHLPQCVGERRCWYRSLAMETDESWCKIRLLMLREIQPNGVRVSSPAQLASFEWRRGWRPLPPARSLNHLSHQQVMIVSGTDHQLNAFFDTTVNDDAFDWGQVVYGGT